MARHKANGSVVTALADRLKPVEIYPEAMVGPVKAVVPADWIVLKSKRRAGRECVVRVRLSLIAAVWEDDGTLDGPYFVQAGGRTFHPQKESFDEVREVLGL